jgi:hypothetical protein
MLNMNSTLWLTQVDQGSKQVSQNQQMLPMPRKIDLMFNDFHYLGTAI